MTPQEVRNVVRHAIEMMDEIEVPGDLREVAFREIVRLLTGGYGSSTQGTSAKPETPNSESGPIQELAKRLNVKVDLVSDNFVVTNGALRVAVPESKLPAKKAAATRDLALLVAAAEQYSSAEMTTPVKNIRDACDEYSRLDGPNFAKHLQGGDSYWSLKNGQLKLRIPGWDEAAKVLKRLGEG